MVQPPIKQPSDRAILTIGHSNHDGRFFIDLLTKAGVELVVDIRSQPYSRYTPHFNRAALEKLLAEAGIDYRHEPGLGGRPDDPAMYDETGHVLYGLVADSPAFSEAVERLEGSAQKQQVAIMCGEENPTDCHRRLLVGRVLQRHGRHTKHIRKDGNIQHEHELPPAGDTQEGLFEGGEFSSWRSIQSVSPRSRPPSSSGL
ncbi:MAG: DUF488 domain-containing protein [bacterium]|nr:DUF488 domain-containing protein [bacterium]